MLVHSKVTYCIKMFLSLYRVHTFLLLSTSKLHVAYTSAAQIDLGYFSFWRGENLHGFAPCEVRNKINTVRKYSGFANHWRRKQKTSRNRMHKLDHKYFVYIWKGKKWVGHGSWFYWMATLCLHKITRLCKEPVYIWLYRFFTSFCQKKKCLPRK